MKCRGNDIRKKIVKEYYVEPVAHLKLLANQTKHSDAEATIEDEYYIFSAKRKKDGHEEIILCGMGAAKDFLKLLGHSGLSLFNPLKEDNSSTSIRNSNSSGIENDNEWNPVAKQLYNAIMLLITIWGTEKIGTPLFNLKKEVVKYKRCNPFDSKIKSLNTMIKNGGNGRTLTEIINYYGKYNKFKSNICEFNLLEARINEMTDKNENKVESFF